MPHGRTASILVQPPERRRQVRQLALLKVALLHARDTSDICVVKNVSPNGLSMRVYRKLDPGDRVQIEFRSGELLAGSVVWEQDWDVGMIFDEPIDVSAVLANRLPHRVAKRRALPRISVNCHGQLSNGLQSVNVVLHDISQGGASLEIEKPSADVRMGNVRLSLPGLAPIAGVVRWTSGTKVGVSFNECIAFERLAQWIQVRREGFGSCEMRVVSRAR